MSETQVAVLPKDYGLEESQASPLVSGLQTVIAEREILRQQYLEIIAQEVTPELSKKAKECRLKIKDNRTKGIMPWHKTNKEVPLRLGQFIDAVKNKEVLENEQMEQRLEEIEKYVENQEKARIADLDRQRKELLRPFEVENLDNMSLGEKSDSEFTALMKGYQIAFEEKKEQERIAKEEAEKAEKERELLAERMKNLRPVWAFLTNEEAELEFGKISHEEYDIVLKTLSQRMADHYKEAEEKNRQIEAKKQRDADRYKQAETYAGFISVPSLLEVSDEEFQEAINKAAQDLKDHQEKEKARKEKEEADAKAAKEAAEKAEKEAEEARIKAKELQDELDRKKAKEEQEEKERLEAIEAEAKKGDEQKIVDLKAAITELAKRFTFESKENQAAYELVKSDLRQAYSRF